MKTKAKTTDEYIRSFPPGISELLTQIRKCVKAAAPRAQEVISYGLPALKQGEVLVFYAAHPNHIGFYPTPSGIEAFTRELSGFTSAKGSVQFPLDKPLPLGLISQMVRFRVREAQNKEKAKKKKG